VFSGHSSMMNATNGLIVSFALVASVGSVHAEDRSSTNIRNHCFFSRELQSWRAADEKTIYIRAGLNRFYRLDLVANCSALMSRSSHLVTRWHGSDSVCSELDWDLRVSEGPQGLGSPCIVRRMTELTPAEAQAIPEKNRP
jgi:hypothetical protein